MVKTLRVKDVNLESFVKEAAERGEAVAVVLRNLESCEEVVCRLSPFYVASLNSWGFQLEEEEQEITELEPEEQQEEERELQAIVKEYY